MTKEDDNKPARTDLGMYRESPPDAPPPAPVQLTEYERNLKLAAETEEFQRLLHKGTPRKWTFLRVVGTLFAGVVILFVLLVGLVLFTCSR